MIETAVRIEREFKASPEEIFDAWTRADTLRLWAWGRLGMNAKAHVDLRVGGGYSVSIARSDGARWNFVGSYIEVDAPYHLVFTLRWEAPVGYEPAVELVRVTLEPSDDGTRMIFTHDGIPDDGARHGHEDGWRHAFDRLEQVLSAAPAVLA